MVSSAMRVVRRVCRISWLPGMSRVGTKMNEPLPDQIIEILQIFRG